MCRKNVYVCVHACMYTCDVGSLFAYVCVNVTVIGSLLFVLVFFCAETSRLSDR
jgi:hypothetical protein